MTVLSIKNYISFPKQLLKDYIDLDFDVQVDAYKLFISGVDTETSSFTIREEKQIKGDEDTIQEFTLTFTELVDNILVNYNQDITANDIISINSDFDQSKFTVEY